MAPSSQELEPPENPARFNLDLEALQEIDPPRGYGRD
jgi:hypothetical protein